MTSSLGQVCVPFVDLKPQTQLLKAELLAALETVLDSTHFCLGPEVEAFEQEFAERCGSRHAVAVNTGTSALQLALQAVGVGRDDEVITVPMTFVASAASILYLGARPVYVDVDEHATLNPELLEAAITARTKAILPVHLYGQAADLSPILEIAARHGIAVVEDAAQAHFTTYRDRPVGTWGRAGAFSFYPGKNLGALGEGGLLVSDDEEVVRDARIRRDWGQTRKYHHEMAGYNFRMDALQGAALRIKLRHIHEWNRRRAAVAERYDRLLAGLPLQKPARSLHSSHIYHLYTVWVEERDEVQRQLAQRGIQTGIHYPIPVHLQPAYCCGHYKAGDFPVAERIARSTLSLPLYPELTESQQDAVVNALRDVLEGR